MARCAPDRVGLQGKSCGVSIRRCSRQCPEGARACGWQLRSEGIRRTSSAAHAASHLTLERRDGVDDPEHSSEGSLVAATHGDSVAQAVQLGIEYDPQPPFDAGSPSKAPAEIREFVTAVQTAAEHDLLAR